MVSRCFPGGYNVKLYISWGRLAWWLLAFLCCGMCGLFHYVYCPQNQLLGARISLIMHEQLPPASYKTEQLAATSSSIGWLQDRASDNYCIDLQALTRLSITSLQYWAADCDAVNIDSAVFYISHNSSLFGEKPTRPASVAFRVFWDALRKKVSIHQLTTVLATSPPANHWCWWPDNLIIARVPGRVIIKVKGLQHQWLSGGYMTLK